MTQTADPIARKRERELNSIYRVGLIATMAFVTVTFAALTLVFILRSQVTFNWHHIILPPILWLDTLLLIASSMAFEIGHRRLKQDDQRIFSMDRRNGRLRHPVLAGSIGGLVADSFAWAACSQ